MPVKQRKIPMRMCVGCREMKPKATLLRVAKPQDADAHIDRTGKAQGRGAYICPKKECFKKARKQGRIAKSLEVPISDELYDILEHEVEFSEVQNSEA